MTPGHSVAPEPPREDLFTPIHKGLRSMIYALGGQIQSADFTDVRATEALVAKLRHDLTVATQSTCVLCVLHEHAGHEEKGVFPALNAHEPQLVQEMLDAHASIVTRLVALSKVCDALLDTSEPSTRVALGGQLVQSANEFFAFYLSHMNREEAEVVPLTWRYFSDEQLRAMRGKIMGSFTPDQMRTTCQWMLPALNVQELTGLFQGLKHGAPPSLLQLLTQVAAEHVDPARWQAVVQRAGL